MNCLKVYRQNDNSSIPTYGTSGSACFDLSACLKGVSEVKCYSPDNHSKNAYVSDGDLVLLPGYRYLVPTGLIFDIPAGYSVRLHPRSGWSLKRGISLTNCEGVVDSDYIDPVFVILENRSSESQHILHGDRIAQAELVKNCATTIVEIGNAPVTKTDRVGGFGSTGN